LVPSIGGVSAVPSLPLPCIAGEAPALDPIGDDPIGVRDLVGEAMVTGLFLAPLQQIPELLLFGARF
jgi:hypothetical protein